LWPFSVSFSPLPASTEPSPASLTTSVNSVIFLEDFCNKK
jgi:hypothetical protein